MRNPARILVRMQQLTILCVVERVFLVAECQAENCCLLVYYI
jgi:hypothetical protein